MNDKAHAVLQRMKRRDARKASRLFRDPQVRERILDEFNRENVDDVEPLSRDQGMAVPKEMNDRESGHDEFVKSLAPSVELTRRNGRFLLYSILSEGSGNEHGGQVDRTEKV
jgi:hypothetical protein